MIITYSEDGLLVPDGQAYEKMRELYREGRDVSVGSDSLIKALSLLIAEDYIPNTDIIVRYNGKDIRYDELGTASHWPEGFVDTMSKMNIRLIRKQSQKRLHMKGRDMPWADDSPSVPKKESLLMR